MAKSAFGLYVAFRAAREGRTVIYDSAKNGQVMFKEGKAYAPPSNIATLDEFNHRETLYICDGKGPAPHKRVCTLLISSPGPEDTKWFELSKSENVRTFTIPVFTDEEMHKLHALAFSAKAGCTNLEVAERISKWGNNPRNVFTHAANDEWQGDLELAASSLELPALLKQLQRRGGLRAFTGKDVRHCLLNMVPKGSLLGSDLTSENPTYYVFDHCELPSVYVEERYAWHILQTQREGLHSFLHAAQEDTSIAGFRGILYERAIVIPRLQSGGSELQLSQLSAPSDASCKRARVLSDATFGPHSALPLHYFQSASQLRDRWKDGKDGLFVPLSKHFPAVDLVLRFDGQPVLMNATVGLSHDIKVSNKKVTELLEALGLDDASVEVPFVWVLPGEAYTDFEAGRPVGASGPLSDSPRHAVGKRLAQYKLLLPVPSSTAAATAVGGADAAMGGAGTYGPRDAGAGAGTDGADGSAAMGRGSSGASGVGARATMGGGVVDGPGTSDLAFS